MTLLGWPIGAMTIVMIGVAPIRDVVLVAIRRLVPV